MSHFDSFDIPSIKVLGNDRISLPLRRRPRRPPCARIPWNRCIPSDSDIAPACKRHPSTVRRSKLQRETELLTTWSANNSKYSFHLTSDHGQFSQCWAFTNWTLHTKVYVTQRGSSRATLCYRIRLINQTTWTAWGLCNEEDRCICTRVTHLRRRDKWPEKTALRRTLSRRCCRLALVGRDKSYGKFGAHFNTTAHVFGRRRLGAESSESRDRI